VLLDWFIFLGSCLLKHFIGGNTGYRRRGERGLTQLLDSLKEEIEYWNLKGSTLDGHHWRTHLEEAIDL
jgi:hypothetical protein